MGNSKGKVGKKWEIFVFLSQSAVTRHPRSCSKRGPSARSCQKINFNYFFWGGVYFFPFYIFPLFFPFFPPFFPTFPPLFSPFYTQFFPDSGGQNSKKTGGSDLNPAPAMQFAAIRVVFQNVVPPFDSHTR